MNTFGQLFRVSTWGESHGPSLGLVIDGCPAGVPLDLDAIQRQLDRRRPGQSRLSTPRRESDRVEVVSGVFEGRTTGAPLAMVFANGDVDSSKYEELRDLYRPSHADRAWDVKFGHRDWRGGGRSSARETVCRVAAGAVAEQLLAEAWGVRIVSWVSAVGDVSFDAADPTAITREDVDANDVRCPDPEAAARIEALIVAARRERDTLGGVISTCVVGVPGGWGEPVFDRMEARLASAMLSIPATRGFEIGAGFAAAGMRGSVHNDPYFRAEDGSIRTTKNDSGGVQGGITIGMPLWFRVAFKPVATHFLPQETVTTSGEAVTFTARGRHDPCVVPRAVPIVEGMTALTLLDLALLHEARRGGSGRVVGTV